MGTEKTTGNVELSYTAVGYFMALSSWDPSGGQTLGRFYNTNGKLLNEIVTGDINREPADGATLANGRFAATWIAVDGQHVQVFSAKGVAKTGTTGGDVLVGGKGNDNLSGDSRSDYLRGGKGNDELVGDGGGDILSGGRGQEFCAGATATTKLLTGLGTTPCAARSGMTRFRDCWVMTGFLVMRGPTRSSFWAGSLAMTSSRISNSAPTRWICRLPPLRSR